jgi:hypothetical protein
MAFHKAQESIFASNLYIANREGWEETIICKKNK